MPDLTLGFELAQSLQRHYAVEVLLREGCVDMQVVYANIACCCASSKNSIRWIRGPRIPPLNVLVERLVGLEGNCRRTHNRDRALGHRLDQRTPGDLPRRAERSPMLHHPASDAIEEAVGVDNLGHNPMMSDFPPVIGLRLSPLTLCETPRYRAKPGGSKAQPDFSSTLLRFCVVLQEW